MRNFKKTYFKRGVALVLAFTLYGCASAPVDISAQSVPLGATEIPIATGVGYSATDAPTATPTNNGEPVTPTFNEESNSQTVPNVPNVPTETVPNVPTETVPTIPNETVPTDPNETVPTLPTETDPNAAFPQLNAFSGFMPMAVPTFPYTEIDADTAQFDLGNVTSNSSPFWAVVQRPGNYKNIIINANYDFPKATTLDFNTLGFVFNNTPSYEVRDYTLNLTSTNPLNIIQTVSNTFAEVQGGNVTININDENIKFDASNPNTVGGFFRVAETSFLNCSLTIKNLNYIGGKIGAIYAGDGTTLNLINPIMKGANGEFTLISSQTATVNIENGLFENNYSSSNVMDRPSVISALGEWDNEFKTAKGTLNIKNSTFRGNGSNISAGVIYARSVNVNIENSTFENNTTNKDGGAILNDQGMWNTGSQSLPEFMALLKIDDKTVFENNKSQNIFDWDVVQDNADMATFSGVYNTNIKTTQYDTVKYKNLFNNDDVGFVPPNVNVTYAMEDQYVPYLTQTYMLYKPSYALQPEDPTLEGKTFYNWYYLTDELVKLDPPKVVYYGENNEYEYYIYYEFVKIKHKFDFNTPLMQYYKLVANWEPVENPQANALQLAMTATGSYKDDAASGYTGANQTHTGALVKDKPTGEVATFKAEIVIPNDTEIKEMKSFEAKVSVDNFDASQLTVNANAVTAKIKGADGASDTTINDSNLLTTNLADGVATFTFKPLGNDGKTQTTFAQLAGRTISVEISTAFKGSGTNANLNKTINATLTVLRDEKDITSANEFTGNNTASVKITDGLAPIINDNGLKTFDVLSGATNWETLVGLNFLDDSDYSFAIDAAFPTSSTNPKRVSNRDYRFKVTAVDEFGNKSFKDYTVKFITDETAYIQYTSENATVEVLSKVANYPLKGTLALKADDYKNPATTEQFKQDLLQVFDGQIKFPSGYTGAQTINSEIALNSYEFDYSNIGNVTSAQLTARVDGKDIVSYPIIVVKDTTKPIVELLTDAKSYTPDATITNETITTDFLDKAIDNYSVYGDATNNLEVWFEDANGTKITNFETLTAGEHVVSIHAKDASGNFADAKTFTITIESADASVPVITANTAIRYALGSKIDVAKFKEDVKATMVDKDALLDVREIKVDDYKNVDFNVAKTYFVTLTGKNAQGVFAIPVKVGIIIYDDRQIGGDRTETITNPTAPTLPDVAPIVDEQTVQVGETLIKALYNPETNEYQLFDENGAPLGTVTVPEGKTLEEYLLEEDAIAKGSLTPQAADKTNPKTGDTSNLASLILFALIGAGLLIAFALVVRKKSK